MTRLSKFYEVYNASTFHLVHYPECDPVKIIRREMIEAKVRKVQRHLQFYSALELLNHYDKIMSVTTADLIS